MSSPITPFLIMCLLPLISNHLCPTNGEADNHNKWGRSDPVTLPMQYGTKAPLMSGLSWGCPCNGPNGMRCGCDNTGCGCTYPPSETNKDSPPILGSKYSMPIQQPPWQCPCDTRCGCDHSGCGCSATRPTPRYGCPPNVGYCQCYPDDVYCRYLPPLEDEFEEEASAEYDLN